MNTSERDTVDENASKQLNEVGSEFKVIDETIRGGNIDMSNTNEKPDDSDHELNFVEGSLSIKGEAKDIVAACKGLDTISDCLPSKLSQTKRPRGRPRKRPPPPTIKRPRGRPKKRISGRNPPISPTTEVGANASTCDAFSSLDILSAAALSSVISAAPIFAASAAPFNPNNSSPSVNPEGSSDCKKSDAYCALRLRNDGALVSDSERKDCSSALIQCGRLESHEYLDWPIRSIEASNHNKLTVPSDIGMSSEDVINSSVAQPSTSPFHVKRARGRPRKNVFKPDLPRRPRGRPPIVHRLALTSVKQETSSVIRRVRGRPPGSGQQKRAVSSRVAKSIGSPPHLTTQVSPTSPRKRGRPPKEKPLSAVFVKTTKRPRGRPPLHADVFHPGNAPYTYAGPVSLSLASVLSASERFEDIYNGDVIKTA